MNEKSQRKRAESPASTGQKQVRGDTAMRETNPAVYLRLIASLVPARVEVSEGNPFDGMTDAELDAFICRMQRHD